MAGSSGQQENAMRAIVAVALVVTVWLTPLAAAAEGSRKPNIVFILADDLGYGDLGCYGQQNTKTPHIDRLASQGVRFTQFYSGAPVCAPSRCTLLTGLHTGHCYIRDNGELPTEGQRPIPSSTFTLAEALQSAGYRTGVVGKWGLGGPGTEGEPNRQGFDHWFGYLCQREAHRYYPQHLWRNGSRVVLEANENGGRGTYAHDLIADEALQFVRDSAAGGRGGRPFFLYVAFTIPHVDLDAPDAALAQYAGQWEEKPFPGNHYRAHPTPRAAYAAMISRMDRDVCRLMGLLKELHLDEDTLVMFSSDNGPTYAGGADPAFFNSAGGLRGLKEQLYEGGIRVPLVARWPGKIAPGTTSDHVAAMWDLMPTFAELAGAELPTDVPLDGVSFLPTLLGKPGQKPHDPLYWESPARQGAQAVRIGDWKGVRLGVKRDPDAKVQLFNLKDDPAESRDVADQHPEQVARIERVMREGRTESPIWPLLAKPGR
jgi:arylsulfatase A-like enzyme